MISFAVTAYEESRKGNYGWIQQCVTEAGRSGIVSEIIVVDDCSSDYPGLERAIAHLPKVRLLRNAEGKGVLGNKVESVSQCTRPWVQICDSDDVMDAARFNVLASLYPWRPDTFYCNSWGRPQFDYRTLIGRWDLQSYIAMFGLREYGWVGCQVNTGNHFVSRDRFLGLLSNYETLREEAALKVFGRSCDHLLQRAHDGSDSAFYNTRWLLAEGYLEIVAGLEYEHRVDPSTSAWADSPPEKIIFLDAYTDEMGLAANETEEACNRRMTMCKRKRSKQSFAPKG